MKISNLFVLLLLYNGILVSAKNNYEDKKLEILGRFYGEAIFHNDLEPYLVHFLLSILNNLNYKQLCIISVIGQYEKYFTGFKDLEALKRQENWYAIRIVQNELSNLILTGLLQPLNDVMVKPVSERHIRRTQLSPIGEMLFNISDLKIIDENDLLDILRLFK